MVRPSGVRRSVKAAATASSPHTSTALASGTPGTTVPLASHVIGRVAELCGANPPVSITISPRSTALTPKVKIIDGTRSTATPRPLNRPTPRPTPSAAGIAQTPPTAVPSIALAAIVHGTDRSICPSRITSIMPMAIVPRNAAMRICCSR